MPAPFELCEAARDQQQVISNLLQLYLYEFSAGQGTDVCADGRFPWDGLEDYWSQDGLHPFLLTVDGKLAGFALVQRILASDGTLVWDIEDFFVMAKDRRSGLGAFAADQLFHRFAGPWQIRVLCSNGGALAFWHSAVSRLDRGVSTTQSAVDAGRVFRIFRFET